MHAEVVNGMDVLAVRDAVTRAAELCRAGEGPVLIEASTYRYYGHSLSDPRNEYRTREEEAAWKAVDPIEKLKGQLVESGIATADEVAAVVAGAADRNARAAKRAAAATDPDPSTLLDLLYTDGTSDVVPAAAAEPDAVRGAAGDQGDAEGKILYRDAIRTRWSTRCAATAASSSTARTWPTTAARSR